jgi:hypothetical protein
MDFKTNMEMVGKRFPYLAKYKVYGSPKPTLRSNVCVLTACTGAGLEILLKNSLIIHEENTKKNHKRVVSVYVIQIHVDLHKL